jgi:hypothetical protein
MLEKEDLEKIGTIVRTAIREETPAIVRPIVYSVANEVMNKALLSFWEYNLEPAFAELHNRIDETEERGNGFTRKYTWHPPA